MKAKRRRLVVVWCCVCSNNQSQRKGEREPTFVTRTVQALTPTAFRVTVERRKKEEATNVDIYYYTTNSIPCRLYKKGKKKGFVLLLLPILPLRIRHSRMRCAIHHRTLHPLSPRPVSCSSSSSPYTGCGIDSPSQRRERERETCVFNPTLSY